VTCHDALTAMDAYLDDELTVLEALRVQQHLGRCASCRQAAESEAALHSLVAAEAMQEAPPTTLQERILQSIRAETGAQGTRPRRPRRSIPFSAWLPRGALAGLLLACLALPGTGGPADAPFAGDVVARHLRYTTSATPDLDLTTPDASRLAGWLHQRLGFAVGVPPAAGRGERLLGGRVSTIANRPAAYVLYEGEGGRRVSLFVARRWARAPVEGSEESIEGVDLYTATLNGVSLAWWADDSRFYLALARAGATDLRGLAVLCINQRGLTAGAPARLTEAAAGLGDGPRKGGSGSLLLTQLHG
jgi:mycothiol system anti-sigma-R factor